MKAREELRVAGTEIPALYDRMAVNNEFAAKYDAAYGKHDRATLAPHLKMSGFTAVEASDDWTLYCYGPHVCTKLPPSAAAAAAHRVEHVGYQRAAEEFLDRLSSDEAYGTRLQAAIMEGNRAKILAILREGGLKGHDIMALTFEKDVKIHFQWDWIVIHIEW